MKAYPISDDTKTLFDALNAGTEGQLFDYEHLGTLVGRSLDGSDSHLQSALAKALKEGAAFENVRGVGYRRLGNAGVVATAPKFRKSIRRRAKKGLRHLSCADFDKLTNEQKIAANTETAVLGVLGQMSSASSQKKVAAVVRDVGNKLAIATTLQAFMDKKLA